MCRLSKNLGASTSWSPKGLPRPVMELLYLYVKSELPYRHYEMNPTNYSQTIYIYIYGRRVNTREAKYSL
jgi:hypothetical protein